MDSDLPGVLRNRFAELAPKVLCALKKLKSSFINPEATKLVEELSGAKASDETNKTSETSKSETGREVTYYLVAHFLLDVCNFSWPDKEPSHQYEEPRTFQEAWNHPDPTQRVKWRDGIKKEFHDMTKRRVWKRIKKKDIPSG